MFNQITIIGNLTKEWETKILPSGTEINNSAIATTHKYKKQNGEQVEETMFLDVSSMGKQGTILKQYTAKGSKVFLQGRLVFQQWKAQDGTSRSRHTMQVSEFKFLDSKKDGGHTQPNQQMQNNQQYQQNMQHQQQNMQQQQQQQQQMPSNQPYPIDADANEIPF